MYARRTTEFMQKGVKYLATKVLDRWVVKVKHDITSLRRGGKEL